jgi:hypothetical protein
LKVLPSLLPDGPPAIQRATEKIMRGHWRDPDDIRPGAAHTAREVAGYRRTDPLRRCRARHGDRSSFSEDHIIAADILRRLADAVAVGLSGAKDRFNMMFIQFATQPRTGPTPTEVRQARAWRGFQRAMAMYGQADRELLTHVVLLNRSIAGWCQEKRALGLIADDKATVRRLVGILDRLVEHFRGEVDRERNRGLAA